MNSAMELESFGPADGKSQANPRKRNAPSPDEIDEEEEVDRLLPAAAEMKRRRIEEAQEAERNGGTNENSFDTLPSQIEKDKVRKPNKEINIKDVVRERREAAEEAAKRDEENLRETLDGMNVEEMKNLAVVEEMDVLDRAERVRNGHVNGETSSRWDERWNGRKNFKKFRRRGEGTVARRGASVIVPLEEVKKKDFGIGEDYWLESERTKKQRKENERSTQSQSQPFATAKSEPVEIPSELAIDGELPEVIDIDAPRTTRHLAPTQQTDETPNTGRSQNTNRKRPGVSQAVEPAAKKQKRFAVQDSDSDSEDELKLRFKRKGG